MDKRTMNAGLMTAGLLATAAIFGADIPDCGPTDFTKHARPGAFKSHQKPLSKKQRAKLRAAAKGAH